MIFSDNPKATFVRMRTQTAFFAPFLVLCLLMASLVTYPTAEASSKPVKVTAEIQSIENAVKFYHVDNGKWPASLSDMIGKYPPRVPRDPWGRDYYYSTEQPPISTRVLDFYVWSYGSDGVPGGSSFDSDIGSWTVVAQNQRPWWKFW